MDKLKTKKAKVHIYVDSVLVEKYKEFCAENRIALGKRIEELMKEDTAFIEWFG